MIKLTLKNIFIIDGLGAFISAIMLGWVMSHYHEVIGVSVNTLRFLAIIPCFYLLLDIYSHFQEDGFQQRLLRVIAWLNILYCICSVAILFLHIDSLTWLGYAYFIGEIIIILLLAQHELSLANARTYNAD